MSTMSAAVFRSEHQRAHGRLDVTLARRGAATVLSDLRQEGCLKARFPRAASGTEVVSLNVSGGIAGGDALESRYTLAAGATAVFTSQAAERAYRALPADPPARVRSRLTVSAGAHGAWLPQETILFDRAALDRVLEIEMAAGATVVGLETIVFGRAASGERVAGLRLSDVIRVRVDGRLRLHDAVRLDGDAGGLLPRAAVANGASAAATLFYVGSDAEARLNAVRAALTGVPGEAGASAWDGALMVRAVAPDSAALRATTVPALSVLRDGRPLPRVWAC